MGTEPDISKSALEKHLNLHLNGNLKQSYDTNWKTRLHDYEEYRLSQGYSQAQGLAWLQETITEENKMDTYGAILDLVRRNRNLPSHTLTQTIQGIENMIEQGEPKTHFLSEEMRKSALKQDIVILKNKLKKP